MATVSPFSSPSWPTPNPDHPSDQSPDQPSDQDFFSHLPPVKLNPSQHHHHDDSGGEDNVTNWLNQFLPDHDPDHHNNNINNITGSVSSSGSESYQPRTHVNVSGDVSDDVSGDVGGLNSVSSINAPHAPGDVGVLNSNSDVNQLHAPDGADVAGVKEDGLSQKPLTLLHAPDVGDVEGVKEDGLTQKPVNLLHVSFNQDHGCFACGIDHGFRIFNCDPFREIFRRDFDDGGGVGAVEMLFRCNILALVGGGTEPQYPPNKVMIWDDHKSRCIGELSFRSEVRGVRLRRDRIVVVLEQKIFVYNFADLKLLHQIETFVNPKGLCEVSQGSNSFVLVCPGLQKGQVRVEHYGVKKTKFILAHDSRIACFSLAQDGQVIATASSKGTLIRIFDTRDGTLLQEVRRGADRAEIYSLAFSSDIQWLAVSSDKGTVHVFSLKPGQVNQGADKNIESLDNNTPVSSSSSSLSFIKGVLPKYFSSKWSVAQFRLVEGSQYIVAFGHQKNTVVILGMDGSFYRCKFDPTTGGEMTQLEYHNFVKPEDTF